jgi:CheY-specific phosphatase CheX
MNDALNKAVSEAMVELLQSILDGKAESSPAVEAKANSRAYETSVVISFVGSVSGAFALRCSAKLASLVGSRMLGSDVAEGSDEMKDAIGEFLNMVVGAAKARYPSEGEPFKISVPTTIVGSSYVLHIKAGESDAISLLRFRHGAETLCVEVYLK